MKATQPILLVTLLSASAALAVDPPPDGGYPNQNTAEGENALFSLTTGDNNTAVGFHALFSNVNAHNNTAVGWLALQRNTEGLANAAIGAEALGRNTAGDANTAVGGFALLNNSTGLRNTAVGVESLKRNNGSDNIGIGYEAGMNVGTGSNTICIGHMGVSGDSNTIRIGTTGVHTSTNMAGISGAIVANGAAVIVDSDGRLGTIVSSGAFKQNMKPMDEASEAILSLQPVTFQYKKELDPDGIPQFGLIAEEVEKVSPDLVARDADGKAYSVRYEAVNAMLLNEFLKEHRRVETLEARVAAQQKAFASEIATLTAILKAQAALLQKVSDQLAAHKSPALFVADNH